MRSNHVQKMRKYIDDVLTYFDQCILTHKTILQETNANCSYSILKTLKKYYNISSEIVKGENYKMYTVKKKELKENA